MVSREAHWECGYALHGKAVGRWQVVTQIFNAHDENLLDFSMRAETIPLCFCPPSARPDFLSRTNASFLQEISIDWERNLAIINGSRTTGRTYFQFLVCTTARLFDFQYSIVPTSDSIHFILNSRFSADRQGAKSVQ
jgi:hypothetical protein